MHARNRSRFCIFAHRQRNALQRNRFAARFLKPSRASSGEDAPSSLQALAVSNHAIGAPGLPNVWPHPLKRAKNYAAAFGWLAPFDPAIREPLSFVPGKRSQRKFLLIALLPAPLHSSRGKCFHRNTARVECRSVLAFRRGFWIDCSPCHEHRVNLRVRWAPAGVLELLESFSRSRFVLRNRSHRSSIGIVAIVSIHFVAGEGFALRTCPQVHSSPHANYDDSTPLFKTSAHKI